MFLSGQLAVGSRGKGDGKDQVMNLGGAIQGGSGVEVVEIEKQPRQLEGTGF